jgi:hypothetical protein
MIYRVSLAWSQLQKGLRAKCSTAAFPNLFREVESKFLLLQCYTPPRELLLHLLVYKRSPEGGHGGFDGID